MRYPRDPYTMPAKFASKCSCGAPIAKGDSIFYYPNTRSAKGSKCGCADAAQRDFAACMFDEQGF